ncbi:MAG: secondary thiamine-phosphate synthase enzyme YjbQ [Patescibacteria group bacterium]
MSKVISRNFLIKTKKGPEFIDITEKVAKIVEKSKVKHGMVHIFAKHTTAAIKINENEPLLITDMEEFLLRVAAPNGEYNHNDFRRRKTNMCEGECANGHSHCQHLLLSASETVPIFAGKLGLGTWQSIFLVELDRARTREVVVQVWGE